MRFSLTGYIRDVCARLDIAEKHVDAPATRTIIQQCRDATPPAPDTPEFSQLTADYSVITGVIVFIASTARPDVAWYAFFLSSANSTPTLLHMAMAVRIMQYLHTTAELAITYRKSANFSSGVLFAPGDESSEQPHMLADASLRSPRSVSAYCFMLSGAAVFWKVVAQLSPALSTGEAEFYALVSSVATAVHMRQLMAELTYEWLSPMLVFSDGRAARLMVQDGNSTPNVRHIDLKWWFAHYHVELGHVSVHPVRGDKNPVNSLTKNVTGTPFLATRSYLLGLPPLSAASAQMLGSFRRVLFSHFHAAATIITQAWRARSSH